MFRWGRRDKPAPLTGAPAVRRQKTYSAESGYVYQYYFEGRREASRQGESGIEFVFDVSADRKTSFPLPVFVADSAIAPWETAHAMRLASNERYAVAKLALFRAFDERESPEAMRLEVVVGPAHAAEILDQLGVG